MTPEDEIEDRVQIDHILVMDVVAYSTLLIETCACIGLVVRCEAFFTVRMRFDPGDHDEIAGILRKLTEASREEPGCVVAAARRKGIHPHRHPRRRKCS